jgi:Flp pilus assembly pilin Flp
MFRNQSTPTPARGSRRGRRGVVRVIPPVPVKSVAGGVDSSGMNALTKAMCRLARDERGGEVLEYALVAGLIVIAAIAVIGSVGTKVLARWNSVNSSL